MSARVKADFNSASYSGLIHFSTGVISFFSIAVLLLGGKPDLIGIPDNYNLVVFANRRIPEHFERPLHADFIQLSRLPDCLVCGAQADPAILQQADDILAKLNSTPPRD